MKALVVLCTLLAVVSLALAQPKPPVWPNQFRISFKDSGGHPGHMFYNWDIRRQRVDHTPGSAECVNFLNTTMPCSLIFGPTQWNAVFPVNKSCCIGEDTGLVRPDFVKDQAWHGVVPCPCNQALQCDFWGGDANGEHKYYSVVDSGVPCAFLFNAASTENFLFDTTSFKVGPQDPKIFQSPSPCVKQCPTNH